MTNEYEKILEKAVGAVELISDTLIKVMKLQMNQATQGVEKEASKLSCTIVIEQYVLMKMVSSYFKALNAVDPKVKTKIQNEMINRFKEM
jgi:hypothetical protein